MSKFTEANSKRVANRMAALAYLRSVPIGLGHLHVDYTDTIESIELYIAEKCWSGDHLDIDYLKGRCMKLSLVQKGNDCIGFEPLGPDAAYQTWASAYPTYQALFDAAINSLQEVA